MSRITTKIGNAVEFIDGKGYSNLSQKEEKRLLLNTLADCEDRLEDDEHNIMSAISDLETCLYKQTDKSLEIKASVFWGALTVAKESGHIDWDAMINLFGEFMSKQLNLR
ncbi:hypothetical protein HYH96_17790 [Clostridium botulinum]|uniref:hypothetical protein n=1 Tax=Clostridium botulinum TaxID=1491 RepID=UPI00174DA075|nr:hypothetical protein [Clostridium botulinum]MBD5645725.1 hypothetical protein [Clostridium botulinum]